ncbi:ABC transporter ATP-binding protein [Paenibacillus sp. J2TS4]|uniref:ABC transporter ATP-binding protein n=1 Tax=Paenibacillus sp. J2TS4 TaxID=2807194 RepID=UPI001B13C1FA|nr:sn-glycerol-3-phosphate ABC transporter ATP-binding protein UgpC [Paenibacillus sp. J2TS4]GIP31140.1 sugar ABC transporter ATP-binding protein [Paenibacillus sp. J2TS4]
MAEVRFVDIVKEFEDEKKGKVVAVNNANFTIKDREFLVFVGPSGCGKTTSLRMVAGLERQTSGDIYIGSRLVNKVHPKDRDIAMVFQDYALYPHMTIRENLGFGLKNLKTPKKEIEKKITEAAAILSIENLLDRKPRELSGGQKQRIAVGRAIVRNPSVFLFDEPLSNLDAKLRVQMRVELSELHKRLGATVIYVTHDQVEAMTLGERIVVMNDGEIQQIAVPEELYEKPNNMFVAGFIGSPPMNFVKARLDGNQLYTADYTFTVPEHSLPTYAEYNGKEVVFGIRPEDIVTVNLLNIEPEKNVICPTLKVVEHLGAELLLYFNIGGEQVTSRVSADAKVKGLSPVKLYCNLEKMQLFDPATQQRIG